jgi:hypothetical protein
MCNFEFEEYTKTFENLFYRADCHKIFNDPCLDIRTRLKINFPGGNNVRKVYKGGELVTFEEVKI